MRRSIWQFCLVHALTPMMRSLFLVLFVLLFLYCLSYSALVANKRYYLLNSWSGASFLYIGWSTTKNTSYFDEKVHTGLKDVKVETEKKIKPKNSNRRKWVAISRPHQMKNSAAVDKLRIDISAISHILITSRSCECWWRQRQIMENTIAIGMQFDDAVFSTKQTHHKLRIRTKSTADNVSRVGSVIHACKGEARCQ